MRAGMGKTRRWVAGAACWAACAWAVPAAAAPVASASSLKWDAPPECPLAFEVERDVAELVGPRDLGDLAADAKVWREGGRWRVALVTVHEGERGERILDAGSCAALARATATVLALMIDPEGARARIDAREREEARATPAPPPPPAPSRVVTADAGGTGVAREPRVLLGVGGVVDVGSLPGVAPGVSVHVGTRLASWTWGGVASRVYAEVGGRWFLDRTARGAEGSTAGVELGLLAASARGTLGFGRTVEVGPSFGVEVGRLSGRGYGVGRPLSDEGPFGMVFVGASARWPERGPVGARAQIDAGLPLTRREVSIDGAVAHTTAPVVVRGGLGLEVRF